MIRRNLAVLTFKLHRLGLMIPGRRVLGASLMVFASATLLMGGFTAEDFPAKSFLALLFGTLLMLSGRILWSLE